MSIYTSTVGEKLNDILQKTFDAEKGYRMAAKNTENTYLKVFFKRKSKERLHFGKALKNEITNFGEVIDNSGSVTGAAHRAWMDIKAFFSKGDSEAMLAEAIRGEKAAVDEYKDVLSETDLPQSTADVLMEQMNRIKADLIQVKRLEDLR